MSTKPHIAALMQQPPPYQLRSISYESVCPPPIPIRSKQRPPAPPPKANKLQKRRRPETIQHVGFSVLRGTLGGFSPVEEQGMPSWTETPDDTRLSTMTTIGRWQAQAHEQMPPTPFLSRENLSQTPITSRRDSSESAPSNNGSQTSSALSSPSSTFDNPNSPSDSSSRASSLYSHDDFPEHQDNDRMRELLTSAEILADQYRSLLNSRAEMRTPLPSLQQIRSMTPVQMLSFSENTNNSDCGANDDYYNTHPALRESRSRHVLRTGSPRHALRVSTSRRTLKHKASEYDLRRLTIVDNEVHRLSTQVSQLTSSLNRVMISSPPCSPLFRPASHSSFSTTSQSPNPSQFTGDFDFGFRVFSPNPQEADNCRSIDSNSIDQIQALIEAYEDLQQELWKGREINERDAASVSEMNQVVGGWLESLHGIEMGMERRI